MSGLLLAEERTKVESFKLETPMGSIESDSGNHVIDIISVVGVIAVLYVGKMLISNYIKRK